MMLHLPVIILSFNVITYLSLYDLLHMMLIMLQFSLHVEYAC